MQPSIAHHSRSVPPLPGRSPLARTGQGQSADRLADLPILLDRLVHQDKTPALIELRQLRSLLRSAAPAATEALRLLDAVLDSPLDVDSSVLGLLRSRLDSGPSPCPSPTKALVSQLRATTRTLRQQSERMQQGQAAFEQKRSDRVAVGHQGSAETAPKAKLPDLPVSPCKKTIRGLHVRQGGHDFVIPVEIVERALAADLSRLPTVHGQPVACVSGEMCDVIYLADELGLSVRSNSSPDTLILISLSSKRACLAIDEVVGPVKATVTPLRHVLPDVTAPTDVATLESGGLALVPDFSQLVRRSCD